MTTRRLFAAFQVLFFAAAAPLLAKAPTVKIAVTSPERPTTLEITNAAVRAFPIWAGPGVRINGVPQTEGFIVDWPKGAVPEPPESSLRYRIEFYAGCTVQEAASCRTTEPKLSYVVLYAPDAKSGRGYVYLPGPGEPDYELNTRSISRNDLEGRWYLATADWQSFVLPRLSDLR